MMTARFAMTSSSNSAAARSLEKFSGMLLLVGAGKMGAAMLEGWLTLGIDAKTVVVLEPQPAPEIAALAGRGVRLNPKSAEVGPVSAIVVAIKPQVAPEVMPSLAPYVGASTVVVSI